MRKMPCGALVIRITVHWIVSSERTSKLGREIITNYFALDEMVVDPRDK